VVEGKDFILLPYYTAEPFYTKYGVDIKFPRECINIGTSYSAPMIQVNLYPIRCELYHCDKSHPSPSKEERSHYQKIYYSKHLTLDTIVHDIKGKFRIDFNSSLRCWLKEPNHSSTSSSSSGSASESSLLSSDETTSAKKQRRTTGRMLTSDVVEWDGDWRLLPNNEKTLQELLGGTKEFLEIIIESCPKTFPYSSTTLDDNLWPRYTLLEAWKNDLRCGDMIDAMDRSKNWYEAIITEIDAIGKISIHFKGWANEFDEIILSDQKGIRMKPLHAKTKDRSSWEEGESIELLVSESSSNHPVWMVVTIITKDIPNDKIEIQYSSKTKRESLAKFGKASVVSSDSSLSSSSSVLVTSPVKTTIADDDSIKKKLVSSNNIFDDDEDGMDGTYHLPQNEPKAEKEEKGKTGTGTGTGDVQDDVKVKEWYDLYSDKICPLYTHTAKPKTTSYESGYGSSTSSLYGSPYGRYGPSSSYSSSYSRYNSDYLDKNTKSPPIVNGAVGLQNLGNTCFMNSILQCLSNTDILSSFFLENTYKDEINYDNPLGHNGKVVLSYGKLIKEIWSNAYSLVIPRDFKNTIGEFRPQFAGNEQQDSQEFLNFLLDGLHEDLNRIHHKPHVQKIESKGRKDIIISSESWRRFLLRNDSKLVDSFFGQLKSHVTCCSCQNVSVTFDEYSSLSLPIPIKNTRIFSILVHLLPFGQTLPLKVSIEVEVTTPMSELKKILIDRLIELEIFPKLSSTLSSKNQSPFPSSNHLPLPPSAVSSSSKRNGTIPSSTVPIIPISLSSHNDNNGNSGNTDDGYEMIASPTMITDDEGSSNNTMMMKASDSEENGFHLVSDTSLLPSSSTTMEVERGDAVSTPMSTSSFTSTTNKAFYDSFHFHFAIVFGSRPGTVFKNYNPSDNSSTAISSFITRNDTLVAFQLEYPVKPFKSTSYSYTSYGKKNKFDDEEEEEDDDKVITGGGGGGEQGEGKKRKKLIPYAMDLAMGTKSTSTYSYNNAKLEITSYPYRVSFPSKDNLTNHDIHLLVRQFSRRFLNDDDDALLSSEDQTAWPYELVVTTAFASNVKREIPDDMTPFEPLVEGNEILLICWSATAIKNKFLNEEQLRLVKEVESVNQKEGDDSNKNNNNSNTTTTTRERSSSYSYLTSMDDDEGKNNHNTKRLTVYDCLDKFIEREQLNETETLYCSKCKQHLAPIKKMDVYSCPDILIIHLKRFQFIPGQFFVHREKINDIIDFPIDGLDLSKYVIGPQSNESPPIYDLYGISHHMGGLGGGHYVATAKNHINNKW
jgi:ubiquitin C-terminal hydrolase